MSGTESEARQRNYRFSTQLITNVYSDARTAEHRKTVARLFMGEWAEKLEEVGDELKIRFRGGIGYAPKDSFGNERTLETYFIDVGQGDAILIQTPDDKRVLIDGGKNEGAHSFLKWKYHLKKYEKIFDAVILTHGDDDHLRGLIPILNDEKVLVKRIYHNGIALRSGGKLGRVSEDGKYLVELYDDVEDLRPKYDELSPLYKQWVDAVANAKKRVDKYNKRPESERPEKIDFKCCRADHNTEKLSIGDTNKVEITFIGPIAYGTQDSPKLRVFSKEPGKTVNGNSVAVMVAYKKARILLCGDMNALSEEQALQRYGPEVLHANVFKANHHGSQDFSTQFLSSVKPWVSVVSSGDYPDYGHPRAVLLGCLGRYAASEVQQPLIFSTEIAATFKPLSASQISELDMPAKKAESASKKTTRLHLYEKTIHGMITIRTDGKWLCAGRVYGKQKGTGGAPVWKWEAHAFDLDTGKLHGEIPR